MANVLITGGSGLIGTALTKALLAKGHAVRHLSRTPGRSGNVPSFAWNPPNGAVDPRSLEAIDVIVHLSGAQVVGRRWSKSRLKEIDDSRAEAAHLLHRTVAAHGIRLKAFISASGIGWYGARTDDLFHAEDEPAADDTIGTITRRWEEAADTFNDLCRVVKLRTPLVLAREGQLQQLVRTVRWSVAVPFGSGKQWWPWIHIDDLVRFYVRAITDESLQGSYNVVADEQPDQRTFMRTLARALHRPMLPFGVPGFAMKMVLGRQAELLLEGSRCANGKRLSSKNKFEYEELESALRAILQ